MPQFLVQGVQPLRDKMGRYKKRLNPSRLVWVGYEAYYAIYVHENLQAHHPVGQAKFLEEPARALRGQMAVIINNALRTGATLDEAMYMGGLYLQAESQRLCPVDTGFLRNSAFTLVEVL